MCPPIASEDTSLSDFSNGAVEANTGEHLHLVNYPHDIIAFSQSPAKPNFDEFRRLYLKGLSLNEVSEHTGFPVSRNAGSKREV